MLFSLPGTNKYHFVFHMLNSEFVIQNRPQENLFFFFLNLVLQAELEAFLPCFHRILWVSINAYGTMYWNHIFGSSSISLWVSQGQGPYIINICIPKSTMLWGTPTNIHWFGVFFLCFYIQTLKMTNNYTNSHKGLRVKNIPGKINRKRTVEMECKLQAQVFWQVLPRGRLV